MLAITLIVLAYLGVSTKAQTSTQKDLLRYRVVTDETATFYVGKQGSFKIVLFDYYGKRVAPPRDLKTTITVTTLGTPDEAKDWLASKKIQSRPSISKSRVQGITSANDSIA